MTLVVVVYCVASHFFFFFKQKTAYEMRISDWSSDVCSSDLSTRGQDTGQYAHRHKVYCSRALTLGRRPTQHPQHCADGREQIGRASCRERVLSVRVDLGGRRIIKKKKKKLSSVTKCKLDVKTKTLKYLSQTSKTKKKK